MLTPIYFSSERSIIIKDKLLEVSNLHTYFHTSDGLIPAVDGVSLNVNKGETLAIVGESGSGKSVTALSILRLILVPPGEIKADGIWFEGINLLSLSEEKMRKVRGNDISMIFQEPMTSLNPVLTVGFQIVEMIELHKGMRGKKALDYVVELFKMVEMPAPEKQVHEYPHQLSGGMRQRVMIAMALSCNPKLLIADEPTTALDVTIQAQILELIADLRKKFGMAIIIITHNLGVVAEVAERVIVMYAGQVLEEALVKPLFKAPLHPYTYSLLRTIPSIDKKISELAVIKGVVPSPMFYPKGCRFSPRCEWAREKCIVEQPPLTVLDKDRSVRCWYPLTTQEARDTLENRIISGTKRE